MAAECASAESQILQYGLGKEYQIDLARALSPQCGISEAQESIAASFRRRHTLLSV
jgi:hypothetical protein